MGEGGPSVFLTTNSNAELFYWLQAMGNFNYVTMSQYLLNI